MWCLSLRGRETFVWLLLLCFLVFVFLAASQAGRTASSQDGGVAGSITVANHLLMRDICKHCVNADAYSVVAWSSLL